MAAVQAHCGLSDREAEIVLLMMHGRNVPAIAEELVISQNTVRTHVKGRFRLPVPRLGPSGRSQPDRAMPRRRR